MDRKPKIDFLSQASDETYEVSGDSVAAIIESLLRIVLAFMPDPEQAKGHIDRVAALVSNEMAEEAERRKFGR